MHPAPDAGYALPPTGIYGLVVSLQGIGLDDTQHQPADQRTERANEQPVSGETTEACWVSGRRTRFGREQGAPSAIGFHTEVEGYLHESW